MEKKLAGLKGLDKGNGINMVALNLKVAQSTIGDWKKRDQKLNLSV